MKYWVIGSGGLIGSAVSRAARAAGHEVHLSPPVPWSRADDAIATLIADGRKFVSSANGPWSLVWCAGTAVTHSSRQEFALEERILKETLSGLDGVVSEAGNSGALAITSSAGGIYGGSSEPPFSEESVEEPLGEYGRFKLRCEHVMAQAAERWAVPFGSARLGNVYGPGQDLQKTQGLISRLCLSALRNEPMTIYVPFDTTRDYIYVDDAGRRVERFVQRLHASDPGRIHVKVIATGVAQTVASVIGECRRLPALRPLVVQRASDASALQARDLRLTSTYWPDLDEGLVTPLVVGIAATAADLGRRMASAHDEHDLAVP